MKLAVGLLEQPKGACPPTQRTGSLNSVQNVQEFSVYTSFPLDGTSTVRTPIEGGLARNAMHMGTR